MVFGGCAVPVTLPLSLGPESRAWGGVRSHAPCHDLCLDAVPRMMERDQHGPDYHDDGRRGSGLDGGQRRPIWRLLFLCV